MAINTQHITKVAVLGAGESGVGAALLCKSRGIAVFVSDGGSIKSRFADELLSANIPYEEGQHSEVQLLQASHVVKSPGIPNNTTLVETLVAAGIPVISEIEFASYFTNAVLIGITGTNGKTTTTLLTQHLLQSAGLYSKACGNVGTSMARVLSQESPDYLVIEISSFQLENIQHLRLNVAILLNITPDHLDRYETLDHYAQAKCKIAERQTPDDLFIYNCDDTLIRKHLPVLPGKAERAGLSQEYIIENGAYIDHHQIHLSLKKQTTVDMTLEDILLKGAHNRYNTMAAMVAARSLSIKKETIRESLSSYKNVEHRLEHVARIKSVDYINDSKATNINATWYALESMETPTVWIVGGIDKGNDYSQLYDLVREKVKAVVCLGVNNDAIKEAFTGVVPLVVETHSMQDAVKQSYQIAEKDETVLLAPACASFDLFDDYIDRGNQFKRAVLNL